MRRTPHFGQTQRLTSSASSLPTDAGTSRASSHGHLEFSNLTLALLTLALEPDSREERLRLRHVAEGRNPPSVMPPLPPPNLGGGGGGGGSNHTPSRVGGAWQAGVVGVGVAGAGTGESGHDEGRGRRGSGGVGAATPRKLEVGVVCGCLPSRTGTSCVIGLRFDCKPNLEQGFTGNAPWSSKQAGVLERRHITGTALTMTNHRKTNSLHRAVRSPYVPCAAFLASVGHRVPFWMPLPASRLSLPPPRSPWRRGESVACWRGAGEGSRDTGGQRGAPMSADRPVVAPPLAAAGKAVDR